MILKTCFYNIDKALNFYVSEPGPCGCFPTKQAETVLVSLMCENQACFSQAECDQFFGGSTDYLDKVEADLSTKGYDYSVSIKFLHILLAFILLSG